MKCIKPRIETDRSKLSSKITTEYKKDKGIGIVKVPNVAIARCHDNIQETCFCDKCQVQEIEKESIGPNNWIREFVDNNHVLLEYHYGNNDSRHTMNFDNISEDETLTLKRILQHFLHLEDNLSQDIVVQDIRAHTHLLEKTILVEDKGKPTVIKRIFKHLYKIFKQRSIDQITASACADATADVVSSMNTDEIISNYPTDVVVANIPQRETVVSAITDNETSTVTAGKDNGDHEEMRHNKRSYGTTVFEDAEVLTQRLNDTCKVATKEDDGDDESGDDNLIDRAYNFIIDEKKYSHLLDKNPSRQRLELLLPKAIYKSFLKQCAYKKAEEALECCLKELEKRIDRLRCQLDKHSVEIRNQWNTIYYHLLIYCASIYLCMDQFIKANEYLEKCRNAIEVLEDALKVELLITTARYHKFNTDNAKAKHFYDLALTWIESMKDDDLRLRALASCHEVLASVLKQQCKYQEAYDEYEKAVDYLDQLSVNEETDTDCNELMGKLKMYQGDCMLNLYIFDAACLCFASAQERFKSINNRLGMTRCEVRFGDYYFLIGQFKESYDYHLRGLSERQAIYQENPDHVEIAASHNRIGWTLHCWGYQDAAQAHFKKSREMRTKRYGEENGAQRTLGYPLSLAMIRDAGRLLEEYRNEFESMKQSKKNHLRSASGFERYANLLMFHSTDQCDDMLECVEESLKFALAIRQSIIALDSNANVIAAANDCWGKYHFCRSDFAEARNCFEKSLEMRCELFQNLNHPDAATYPNHPNVATSLINLAIVNIVDNKSGEGLQQLRIAKKLLELNIKSNEPHKHSDLSKLSSQIASLSEVDNIDSKSFHDLKLLLFSTVDPLILI